MRYIALAHWTSPQTFRRTAAEYVVEKVLLVYNINKSQIDIEIFMTQYVGRTSIVIKKSESLLVWTFR